MIVIAFMMPLLSPKTKDKEEEHRELLISKEGDLGTESQRAWKYGMVLSVLNLGASTFQQVGIVYISASEAAFVTGFYIVFCPFISMFLPGKENKPVMSDRLVIYFSIICILVTMGLLLDSICFPLHS